MRVLAIIIVFLLSIALFSCDDTSISIGLQFDGIDDYVQVPGGPFVRTDLPVTLSGWVNPDSDTETYRYIFGKTYIWSYSYGFQQDADYQVRIRLRLSRDPEGAQEHETGAYLTPGVWQHIALTHDGTSTLRFYLNGSEVYSTTSAIPIGENGNPFYLGRTQRDIDEDGHFFKGFISDVRVYDSALSAADIDKIYKGDDELMSGLIGHWKFDEGDGTIAYDSSGNDNHGTLYGDPVWFTGGD